MCYHKFVFIVEQSNGKTSVNVFVEKWVDVKLKHILNNRCVYWGGVMKLWRNWHQKWYAMLIKLRSLEKIRTKNGGSLLSSKQWIWASPYRWRAGFQSSDGHTVERLTRTWESVKQTTSILLLWLHVELYWCCLYSLSWCLLSTFLTVTGPAATYPWQICLPSVLGSHSWTRLSLLVSDCCLVSVWFWKWKPASPTAILQSFFSGPTV